jgi:hypothetical protein
MAELPSGTVTLRFTDIEGSTRLLTRLRGGYIDVLAERQRLLPTLTRHAPPKRERDGGRRGCARDAPTARPTAQRRRGTPVVRRC